MGEKKQENKGTNKAFIAILAIIVIAVIIVVMVMQNRTSSEEEENGEEEIENTANINGYVQTIDGVKVNISSELNTAKKVDGLSITNIQLSTRDGMTTFLADVTNNTGAATEVKTVKITLVDKDGAELITVGGIINALEDGETTELNVAMTSDYVDAYDFIITTD